MLDLLKKINTLKRTPRIGWVESGIEPRKAEDVAQHSFETSSITLLLAQKVEDEIDVDRATKMAVLHDWSESVTGDYSKSQTKSIGESKKIEIEKKSMEKILPDSLSDSGAFLEIWEEYTEKKTKEARLVFVSDRLSILLEINYLTNHGEKNKKLKKIGEDVRSELTDFTDEFPFLTNLLESLDQDTPFGD